MKNFVTGYSVIWWCPCHTKFGKHTPWNIKLMMAGKQLDPCFLIMSVPEATDVNYYECRSKRSEQMTHKSDNCIQD